jgi:hypothetical protein
MFLSLSVTISLLKQSILDWNCNFAQSTFLHMSAHYRNMHLPTSYIFPALYKYTNSRMYVYFHLLRSPNSHSNDIHHCEWKQQQKCRSPNKSHPFLHSLDLGWCRHQAFTGVCASKEFFFMLKPHMPLSSKQIKVQSHSGSW